MKKDGDRSKRRRENRHPVTRGDDTLEGTVNDEDGLRMLPPLSPSAAMTKSANNKVFREAANEMMGVSVPRKVRTASAKRSHEGADQFHHQSSTSPANGGGSKPRPEKCSSDLEIEIAEVLYGIMTQSQAPPKKEIPSTSPISAPPQNFTSLSVLSIVPKRKRPHQVSDNPFSVGSIPVKTEIDHQHQSPKSEISSPNLENNDSVSAIVAENGVPIGFTTLPNQQWPVVEEEGKCCGDVVWTKQEFRFDDGNGNIEAMTATTLSKSGTIF